MILEFVEVWDGYKKADPSGKHFSPILLDFPMIKRSYTVTQKLKVVEAAIERGFTQVSVETKIHRTTIHRWCKKKDELEAVKNKNARKLKESKPVLSEEEEGEIHEWITRRNDTDLVVTHGHVQRYCLYKYGHARLKFSTGWFSGFKKRHRLSRRRVTSFSRRPRNRTHVDLTPKIQEFRQEISELDPSVPLVNMDETPVWFDNPYKYTVTRKGTRHPSTRETCKKRVTVVLACQSDGVKLDPMVILAQKYKGPVPAGIRVAQQPKAWMTGHLTLEWLNSIDWTGRHLIFDSFSGHKTAPVKEKLTGISHTYVPAGCTSKCQPLDVGVNKPFKDRLKKYWDDYVSQDRLTRMGNYEPPSTELVLRWIDTAWKDISVQTIKNSFKCSRL